MTTTTPRDRANAHLEEAARKTPGAPQTSWLTAALVEATLELAEQQRIANLIALGSLEGQAGMDPLGPLYERPTVSGPRVLTSDIQISLRLAESDAEPRCSTCGSTVDVDVDDDSRCYECAQRAEGLEQCPNCGEWVGAINYRGTPHAMCDGCLHNARRSGWEEPTS